MLNVMKNCMYKIVSVVIAAAVVFGSTTFCGAVKVDDAEITRMAEKVYEEACKVWDEAYADEQALINEGKLNPKDALTNMVEGNFVEKTKQILEKYRPFNNKAPKVLSHEEFEEAKKGKSVCYRGITENVKSRFTLEEKTQHLLTGKFNNGIEGGGIFSSFVKDPKCLEVGQTVEKTAEFYAYTGINNDTLKGRLFTFFYDPNTTVVVEDLDSVKDRYLELHPECDVMEDEKKIAQGDNRGLFLMLGNWTLTACKNFSHLLGADVYLPENDNPQIFSTGVLTFDSKYEDADFGAIYPFAEDAIILATDEDLSKEESNIVAEQVNGGTKYYSKHPYFLGSSILIDANLFEHGWGRYKGSQWRYNEDGKPEIVKLVVNILDEEHVEMFDGELE